MLNLFSQACLRWYLPFTSTVHFAVSIVQKYFAIEVTRMADHMTKSSPLHWLVLHILLESSGSMQITLSILSPDHPSTSTPKLQPCISCLLPLKNVTLPVWMKEGPRGDHRRETAIMPDTFGQRCHQWSTWYIRFTGDCTLKEDQYWWWASIEAKPHTAYWITNSLCRFETNNLILYLAVGIQ